jgi:Peptidase family M23
MMIVNPGFRAVVMAAVGAMAMVSGARADDSAVEIAVTPKQPVIERVRGGQSVSFDMIVTSRSAATLSLEEVRLQVFDADGALIQDKLARQGLGAALPGELKLAPKAQLFMLSPFPVFDAAVPLARLRYTLSFVEDTPAKAVRIVSVEVTPRAVAPRTALTLPVRGRVLVHAAHDYLAHHRRVDLTNPVVGKLGVTTNPTRYSYDFCVVDERGAMHRTDGKTNADWYGFGAPIVAPAAGVVLEARGDVADNVLGGKMFDFQLVFADIRAFYGNHVILDHGNGEVSVLAHLKAGSVKVKAGDRVRAGQPIAQMGMSGDADRPHLHYQLQSGARVNDEALPAYFARVRWWRGKRSSPLAGTALETGDIVERMP